MLAYITRHGQTEYRQGKVILSKSDDLTPEGIERVVNSANVAAEDMRLRGIEVIKIKSSPYGRTSHTAKIWKEVLAKNGLRTTKIEICRDLEEVRNLLDFSEYLKFVNGGEIHIDGTDFLIDQSLTNPDNYKPFSYFRKDCIHNRKTSEGLPKNIIQRIHRIETCVGAMARLQLFLNRLEDIPENQTDVIVSHSGPLSSFTEMCAKNGSGTPYINCGMFYVLERNGNIWNPVHIQEGAIQNE